RVEVLNVLGAGDAFLTGFLSGWLRGESYEVCAARGNGSGALVVARHGCAPAMPTPAELDYFLDQAKQDPERMRRPDRDSTLAHLHRVTVPRPRWPELYIFAFDHRSQFAELAHRAGGVPQPYFGAQGIAGRGRGLGGARGGPLCRQAGHSGRPDLRAGCAERGHRAGLVDRQAGGASRLQSAAV